MDALLCSTEEDSKFQEWLAYIESCKHREQNFITNVVLKMKRIELKPWQFLPLHSALGKYYEVFSKWNLVPPSHTPSFKNAYTDGVLIWKQLVGWLCPRHACIHRFWVYLERSVNENDRFKWKVRCYKPKYNNFV